MHKVRSNPTCLACPLAHNSINGRYCPRLGRYVEHDEQPRCDIYTNPLTPTQQ